MIKIIKNYAALLLILFNNSSKSILFSPLPAACSVCAAGRSLLWHRATAAVADRRFRRRDASAWKTAARCEAALARC